MNLRHVRNSRDGEARQAALDALAVRESRPHRLLALAFARGGWRDDGLRAIAEAWINPEATDAALRVAQDGLKRALAGGASLRQQLIGAAAMPDWSDARLAPVVRLAIAWAPNFEAEEIRTLRAWTKGTRS